MKTSYLFAAFVVAMVALSGCLQYGGQANTPSAQPVTTPPANPPTTETTNVAIQNFAFNPSTITVDAGTTVTWTNEDSAPHRIKSDTFNSANLNRGDSFQHTFNTPGTYDYICGIHPSMKGKVVVR